MVIGSMRNDIFRLFNAAILVSIFWLPAKRVFGQGSVVTFDNSTSTVRTGNLSLPFNVGGSNRLLVVQINVEHNDSYSTITDVNYAGAPMSQVFQTIRPGLWGGRQATYILASPAPGTNNLVVNLAGGNNLMEVGVIDYNGVDQNAPVGAVTYVQNPASATQAISLTTTTANSLIVSNFLWYSSFSSLSTLGAGQTQRWMNSGIYAAEGDNKIALTSGPCSMSYILSDNLPADLQAVEIRPCPQTPTPSHTCTTTATQTATNTPTSTTTSTSTATPSSTQTATATVTPTTTNTATKTLTNTATNLSTPTPSPSITETPSCTFTPTPTSPPPATLTPSPTPFPGFRVWPNPFTPQLPTDNLAFFNIPSPHGAGKLMILNIYRQPMRTLSFGDSVTPIWDGKDDSGNIVRGGLYFYLLTVDGQTHRGSIAVLK